MSRVLPKFRELPDDCACLGEGPVPVSRVPRLGAMPELITYQCPACGHIETLEKQPNTPPAIGAPEGGRPTVADRGGSREPIFARFAATCLLAVLFCVMWNNFALAADLQVVGVGVISYRGSIPDAQVRQNALDLAKRDTLQNYVIYLRQKGAFPPYRYRLYLDHVQQIEKSLNQYVTDVVVVDEITERATQKYQVRVRATINEARFNSATSFSRSTDHE